MAFYLGNMVRGLMTKVQTEKKLPLPPVGVDAITYVQSVFSSVSPATARDVHNEQTHSAYAMHVLV